MTEKPSYFDIITVDRSHARPLHAQVYDVIRRAILDGKLGAGVRLPSTRTVARDLGISRNTVIAAYEQLVAEGYLDSKTGSGTHIAALPQRPERQAGDRSKQGSAGKSSGRVQAGISRRGLHLSSALRHLPTYENPTFAPGLPAIDAFPLEKWARIVGRFSRQYSPQYCDYSHMTGLPEFRKAIIQHLGTARGVVADPGQVLVSSSAQAALDLLARLTTDPGDVAWIEDPGYLGARGALAGAGATIVPVPLDDRGLDIEAGRRQSPRSPKLIYVTPSHQCPTGGIMSLARRLELLEFAHRSGAWIIEDDYDSEFRYRGNPIASLQSLDRYGCVIYIGTFSKTMFPGLRIGYIVAPPDLAKSLEVAVCHTGQTVSKLTQAAISEFIQSGYFAEHLRRMRNLYKERQRVFVSELNNRLSGQLTIQPSDTGIQLIARLRNHLDDRLVSETARRFNVVAPPLSRFFLRPCPTPGLFLGYAAVREEEILGGVRQLARAFEAMPPVARRRSGRLPRAGYRRTDAGSDTR
jgi:GntR family transcriptional regulator/MocR family aminotransferase